MGYIMGVCGISDDEPERDKDDRIKDTNAHLLRWEETVGKFIRTNENIYQAVKSWFDDPQEAEAQYGQISEWSTEKVTNMAGLFFYMSEFNENISGWDVSNVTNMQSMFQTASSFNQDLRSWDVSAVINMRSMFSHASSFNQDLSGWDVRNVKDMQYMFTR